MVSFYLRTCASQLVIINNLIFYESKCVYAQTVAPTLCYQVELAFGAFAKLLQYIVEEAASMRFQVTLVMTPLDLLVLLLTIPAGISFNLSFPLQCPYVTILRDAGLNHGHMIAEK